MFSLLDERVKNQAVLLAIDNVWTAEQLDSLLPTEFGEGSRVIFTSRMDSLPQSTVWQGLENQLSIHSIELLDFDSSVKLFRSRSQVLHKSLQMNYLEHKIIQACGGLPLALKVAGGALHKQQDVERWKEVLGLMQQGRELADKNTDKRLRGVLQWSFEALSTMAKNMFLDVVSVLHGLEASLALPVWEAWHGKGVRLALDHLKSSALVGLDTEGHMQVHDVIRALGTSILRDKNNAAFYGTRLWVQDGELVELDQENCQPGNILAFDLRQLHSDGHWEVLRGYTAKDLLQLRIVIGADDWFTPLRLEKLTWYDGNCKGACFDMRPDELQLENLVVLCLRGKDSAAAATAEVIVGAVAACQQRWPRLKYLSLAAKHKLTLPESVCDLHSLESLRAWVCLTELPERLGHLQALTSLSLTNCGISELPDSIDQLKQLRVLDLGCCSRLNKLPSTIGRLRNLTKVDLSGVNRFKQLPDSFGKLKALRSLDLRGSHQLATLPKSCSSLIALQELFMRGCSSLKQYPHELLQLPGLKYDCQPGSFGQARGMGGDEGGGEGTYISAEAPEGSWIVRWEVHTCSYGGVVSIQGVLQDGTKMPELASKRAYGSVCSRRVDPSEGSVFRRLWGRAGWWIDDFMPDDNDGEGGSPWNFECRPGYCIVGYSGIAGTRAVGSIAFSEAPIPDQQASLQSTASLLPDTHDTSDDSSLTCGVTDDRCDMCDRCGPGLLKRT